MAPDASFGSIEQPSKTRCAVIVASPFFRRISYVKSGKLASTDHDAVLVMYTIHDTRTLEALLVAGSLLESLGCLSEYHPRPGVEEGIVNIMLFDRDRKQSGGIFVTRLRGNRHSR